MQCLIQFFLLIEKKGSKVLWKVWKKKEEQKNVKSLSFFEQSEKKNKQKQLNFSWWRLVIKHLIYFKSSSKPMIYFLSLWLHFGTFDLAPIDQIHELSSIATMWLFFCGQMLLSAAANLSDDDDSVGFNLIWSLGRCSIACFLVNARGITTMNFLIYCMLLAR